MKKAVIVGIVILFIIIGISSSSTKNKTNKPVDTSTNVTPTSVVAQTPQTTNTPTIKFDYKILSRKDNTTVENISVLVSVGEINGEAIAMEVKKTCQKKCNIDIYDDQKAYDLVMAYDKMMGNIDTPQSNLTDWKVKNYVYVGDHYIGMFDFSTETYKTYPFRDWYYKELKAKK